MCKRLEQNTFVKLLGQFILILRNRFYTFFFNLVASVGLYYYLLHVYQSVALQHIADRPGKYRTYDAHQPLRFNLLVFLHGDVNVGHL